MYCAGGEFAHRIGGGLKEETQQIGLNIGIVIVSMLFSMAMLGDTYDAEDAATGLLPNIVAVTCFLFCLVILFTQVTAFRETRRASAVRGNEKANASPEDDDKGLQWWWSYLTIAGYFALIVLIGLLWATLVYILIVPVLMHYTKWKIIVLTSAGGMISLYVTFYVFLGMNMPSGILF